MRLVSIEELVDAGMARGVHVTFARVRAAVMDGEIEPAEDRPLRFCVLEANRWLRRQARAQGISLEREER